MENQNPLQGSQETPETGDSAALKRYKLLAGVLAIVFVIVAVMVIQKTSDPDAFKGDITSERGLVQRGQKDEAAKHDESMFCKLKDVFDNKAQAAILKPFVNFKNALSKKGEGLSIEEIQKHGGDVRDAISDAEKLIVKQLGITETKANTTLTDGCWSHACSACEQWNKLGIEKIKNEGSQGLENGLVSTIELIRTTDGNDAKIQHLENSLADAIEFQNALTDFADQVTAAKTECESKLQKLKDEYPVVGDRNFCNDPKRDVRLF